jgi:hypothetical protein
MSNNHSISRIFSSQQVRPNKGKQNQSKSKKGRNSPKHISCTSDASSIPLAPIRSVSFKLGQLDISKNRQVSPRLRIDLLGISKNSQNLTSDSIQSISARPSLPRPWSGTLRPSSAPSSHLGLICPSSDPTCLSPARSASPRLICSPRPETISAIPRSASP